MLAFSVFEVFVERRAGRSVQGSDADIFTERRLTQIARFTKLSIIGGWATSSEGENRQVLCTADMRIYYIFKHVIFFRRLSPFQVDVNPLLLPFYGHEYSASS